MLADISANKYELSAMDSIYRLSLLDLESCAFICQQILNLAGLSSFGIDIIIDSESGDAYVIDLNDFPTLKEPLENIDQIVLNYWQHYKKSITN